MRTETSVPSSEYTTISISLPAEVVEMLREIARKRYAREDRVISLTVAQLVREEHERMKRSERDG